MDRKNLTGSSGEKRRKSASLGKGFGGIARGQGGFEVCCSMERVGKWFMKGWKTAKFTSTKEYYTGTAPDVKAVLSWMDTYKGWDGMG